MLPASKLQVKVKAIAFVIIFGEHKPINIVSVMPNLMVWRTVLCSRLYKISCPKVMYDRHHLIDAKPKIPSGLHCTAADQPSSRIGKLMLESGQVMRWGSFLHGDDVHHNGAKSNTHSGVKSA